MTAERGLAFHIGARLQIGGQLLEHLYVGLDAFRLDRTARWREVTGGGQPQGALVRTDEDDGLHGTFAEGAGADERRALVILQRIGDDFRGRSRAAIDQHLVEVPRISHRHLLARNSSVYFPGVWQQGLGLD